MKITHIAIRVFIVLAGLAMAVSHRTQPELAGVFLAVSLGFVIKFVLQALKTHRERIV